MEWLFGKKKTPAQMLRENQRLLTRAMRDLDRERASMEKQEKKVIADIKAMAKKNEMATVKIMAKDLVRTRATVKKFMVMRANIQVRYSQFRLLDNFGSNIETKNCNYIILLYNIMQLYFFEKFWRGLRFFILFLSNRQFLFTKNLAHPFIRGEGGGCNKNFKKNLPYFCKIKTKY